MWAEAQTPQPAQQLHRDPDAARAIVFPGAARDIAAQRRADMAQQPTPAPRSHQEWKSQMHERPGEKRWTLSGNWETPEETEGRLTSRSERTSAAMQRNPSHFDVSGGEQLKMFMTPHEIHAEYQPLDADRYGRESYQPWSGSKTYTGGSRQTYDDMGEYAQVSRGGTKYGQRQETDEELWQRKANEAYGESDDDDYGYVASSVGGSPSRWSGETPHYHGGGTPTADLSTRQAQERGYAQIGRTPQTDPHSYWTQTENPRYHPGTPGTTLGESIEAEGVHSPIRLGQTIGSMGKPEIVGGHHRLAVATQVNPHQFVPVLHHTDIVEAKLNPSYKYT